MYREGKWFHRQGGGICGDDTNKLYGSAARSQGGDTLYAGDGGGRFPLCPRQYVILRRWFIWLELVNFACFLYCSTWFLIPPAVWEEVTIAGRGLPESACTHDAASKGWLQVVNPCKQWTGLQLGSNELGAGETQAIQLAQERGLRLIIDETAGRNVAPAIGCSSHWNSGSAC